MTGKFVLDNSVVMRWCFEDATGDYAELVLEALESSEAVVPAIWPLEIGNALITAERKKRLSQADTIRFLALVNELPITVEQESPDRMMKEIVALARAHHLSTYDASYLDLAMRAGLPLATQDTALRRAARKSQVPLWAAGR
ncbi:MAG: type II toxin-antitoxin system VapC family toxin [Thermodesulfobacteriota bacterium]